MRFDQAFGNWQAETGSAILAGCRRFGLTKWLQRFLLLLFVHANAMVLDLDDRCSRRADVDPNEYRFLLP